MDVSIIMINYNTYELTKNAIESVFANTSDVQYEIILIDNDSPDKSGDKLKEYFGKKFVYIQAGGNLGVAKANNLGAKQSKGKYLLFLNSDTLIKENFVNTLFQYMESNLQCGICGGNILNFNGEPTHSYLMELPSVATFKKECRISYVVLQKLKIIKSDQFNKTGKPKEVGYITAADMMVRREAFEKIGGFDEDIFMYGDETEFTYRIKKYTQYTVMSVPSATLYHLEGASFGKKRAFKENRFVTQINGDMIFYKKCYGHSGMIKILKIKRNFLRKMRLFNIFLFRFEKARECKAMSDILNKKIKENMVES